MPIIIDGWNFIRDRRSGIRDDGEDSLPAAKMLIAYLQDFQHSHNDPIILVFDSRHEFLDIDYKNSPKLRIVPAQDADNYIKRYIDKTPERQRRNLRVVSSDSDVYYYAKSSYATPLKCEEFWNKIFKDREKLTAETSK
jgi:predicted RNA-binding protein with PIN domain